MISPNTERLLYATWRLASNSMIELSLRNGADSNYVNGVNFTPLRMPLRWTSYDLNESHAAACIIENVTEDRAGINLEDKLRTLDPGHCNLMER
ncbi:hypothetical protein Trydic_g22062, partial [Trypoxylus dichotomus]